MLGAGWLDVCIDSYSSMPADDTQAKRNELAQFIRTMGKLQVGIQSVACMEEASLTVDDDDIASFRFFATIDAFEEPTPTPNPTPDPDPDPDPVPDPDPDPDPNPHQVIGAKLYVAGGVGRDGESLDDLYCLDAENKAWSRLYLAESSNKLGNGARQVRLLRH